MTPNEAPNGFRPPHGWTEAEDDLLRRDWDTRPKRDLAHELGRSRAAVQLRGGVLGLTARAEERDGAEERDRPEDEPTPEAWSPTLPVLKPRGETELAVMAELCRLLGTLDERARTRVLRWLADRWGLWK